MSIVGASGIKQPGVFIEMRHANIYSSMVLLSSQHNGCNINIEENHFHLIVDGAGSVAIVAKAGIRW